MSDAGSVGGVTDTRRQEMAQDFVRRREARIAANAALLRQVEGIAAALGPAAGGAWTARSHQSDAAIDPASYLEGGTHGLTFLVQPAYLKRGKLEIRHVLSSALYQAEADLSTGHTTHAVVVDRERTPESIAAHIWKHLYTKAVHYQTEVGVAIAKHRAAQAEVGDLAARLAAATGGRVAVVGPVGDQEDALLRDADEPVGGGLLGGRVRPSGVNLDLRGISHDQAERVLRVLYGAPETA